MVDNTNFEDDDDNDGMGGKVSSAPAPVAAPQKPAAAEPAKPAVPESPLIKFINMLTGGKKTQPKAAAPAAGDPSATAEAQAAPKKAAAATSASSSSSTEPTPPIVGPLLTVVTRNEFYRDGFRNMIRIAVLEGVVIIGLIVTLIVYMQAAQPTSRYFATTADGRIMQLIPLDQPSMSQAALMSWVSLASTETMTFGFHDYQRRLQQSSRHFTRRGWETFTTALQKSRMIDTITTAQQVVTAEPRGAPILKQQGVFNGKYRWMIQLPLRITYKTGKQSRGDNISVMMVVERVPSLENPNGVGIDQWIAKQE